MRVIRKIIIAFLKHIFFFAAVVGFLFSNYNKSKFKSSKHAIFYYDDLKEEMAFDALPYNDLQLRGKLVSIFFTK